MTGEIIPVTGNGNYFFNYCVGQYPSELLFGEIGSGQDDALNCHLAYPPGDNMFDRSRHVLLSLNIKNRHT